MGPSCKTGFSDSADLGLFFRQTRKQSETKKLISKFRLLRAIKKTSEILFHFVSSRVKFRFVSYISSSFVSWISNSLVSFHKFNLSSHFWVRVAAFFTCHHPRDTSFLRTHRTRDALFRASIVRGTRRARYASYKGCIVKKRRIVQGTHRTRDASYKGCIEKGTHLGTHHPDIRKVLGHNIGYQLRNMRNMLQILILTVAIFERCR
jgi:hypothetical protein